jgi:hypothetical protein
MPSSFRSQKQADEGKVMPPPTPSQSGDPDQATSRPLTAVISPDHVATLVPGLLTDQALWGWVVRHARCADSGLGPDEWFPVSIEPATARREAAAAIAVCTNCAVRAQCLTLSLRHWNIGQHGVWGGLVAADRARLRRRLPAGRPGRRRPAVARGEGTAAILPLHGRLAQRGESQ